jgi:hypothetical protein
MFVAAGLKGKPKTLVDTEAESQYSGHSSATSLRRDAAAGAAQGAGAKGLTASGGRLNNGGGGGNRVKRSGSSSTASRQIPLRQAHQLFTKTRMRGSGGQGGLGIKS